MQEIEYEDGTKTTEEFKSVFDALVDAEKKAMRKPIKSLKISRIIPSKKRRLKCLRFLKKGKKKF